MQLFEKVKVEMELKRFVSQHFKKPSECRNAEQTRFYINELSDRIKALESQYGYVPEAAYKLLADYNVVQNEWINAEFQKQYC